MNEKTESVLYVYRKYQAEKEEKETYQEKLRMMESRYLSLSRSFNLHLDICRSHSEDWRGRKVNNGECI